MDVDDAPVMVFLDVDGALNALGRGADMSDFDDFEAHRVQGFVLRLSRQMVRELRELPVEIWWATTWAEGDTANEEISPRVGLPTDLPIAAAPPPSLGERYANWKLEQIREVVERERRPFVWIDDDAIDADARAWVRTVDVPHLLVVPEPVTGLTRDDLDRIAAFVHAQTR